MVTQQHLIMSRMTTIQVKELHVLITTSVRVNLLNCMRFIHSLHVLIIVNSQHFINLLVIRYGWITTIMFIYNGIYSDSFDGDAYMHSRPCEVHNEVFMIGGNYYMLSLQQYNGVLPIRI